MTSSGTGTNLCRENTQLQTCKVTQGHFRRQVTYWTYCMGPTQVSKVMRATGGDEKKERKNKFSFCHNDDGCL